MSSSECGISLPSTSAESSPSSSVTSIKDIDEIKQDIASCLDTVGDGFFATSGLMPTAVNPGLCIDGLGKIGLPLYERDAKDIIKFSREAPFGKGTEKMVDASVRKTWEINPEQVHFRNPQWPRALQSAVSKAIEQLGVLGGKSSVRADLHKLLLYEEGGFFKTHRDTEKAPGMFATLVIMLPSEHEGGEVVVRLGKERRTLSNPESNEFSYAYLAWYADVNHSIQPVTSGYRLVLTYNLIHHSGNLDEARPPTALEDHKAAIDSAFKSWNKVLEDGSETCDELVYLLDHDYSEANIGLHLLKGEDQIRGLHLQEACRDHGMYLFLAHFEHTHRSENDYDDNDEDSWTLRTLFALDGTCIARSINVEEEAIIQENPFDGQSPDAEESEGWLGNEDAAYTEIYRSTCLVIVQEGAVEQFFSRASRLEISNWTNALLRRMENTAETDMVKAEFLKVCALAASDKNPSTNGLASLLDMTLKLDIPSLAMSAVEKSKSSAGMGALGSLGRALASRDITPWLPVVSSGISSYMRLDNRLHAKNMFRSEYEKAVALSGKRNWTADELEQRAAAIKRCLTESLVQKPKDGRLLVGDEEGDILLHEARSHGDSFVLEVVLPLCKMVVKNIDFVANMSTKLFGDIRHGRISKSTVQSLVSELVAVLSEEMSNHFASRPNSDSMADSFQPHTGCPSGYYSGVPPTAMSWRAITTLFCLCEKLNLLDCVPLLMRPLLEIATTPGKNDQSRFLMPLAKSLASKFFVFDETLSQLQRFFPLVLNGYVKEHVGQKPLPPENLTRKGKVDKCHGSDRFYYGAGITRQDCKICKELNDFLAAPDRMEWHYKAAEPSRKHLEHRIYGLDCSSYTDKSRKTPYTLVIRKNDKSYRDALHQWKQRCTQAQSDFAAIGDEKLRLFLDEEYDSVMQQLSSVTDGKTISPDRQPLGTLPQTAQNRKRANDGSGIEPTEKRARQVEVIDLE